MKIPKRVHKHFLNNISLITILRSHKRVNPEFIAIILTESLFASTAKRLIEYLAWFILTLLNSSRRYTLSVGISQVQIRYWLQYGFIDNKPSIKNLYIFLDPISNYDIVERFILEKVEDSTDKSKLLATFRGETRKYHLLVFTSQFKLLQEIH